MRAGSGGRCRRAVKRRPLPRAAGTATRTLRRGTTRATSRRNTAPPRAPRRRALRVRCPTGRGRGKREATSRAAKEARVRSASSCAAPSPTTQRPRGPPRPPLAHAAASRPAEAPSASKSGCPPKWRRWECLWRARRRRRRRRRRRWTSRLATARASGRSRRCSLHKRWRTSARGRWGRCWCSATAAERRRAAAPSERARSPPVLFPPSLASGGLERSAQAHAPLDGGSPVGGP